MEQLLYLIWKDPKTRRNFTVGRLEKNHGYSFEYYAEADNAEKAGWKRLGAFPEKKKRYESDILFPVFSSRLPDRKRRDINTILEKYGLHEYDEFNLLKKSRAKLPIDTYELIDPIFPEDVTVEKEFYIMGTRYYALCDGHDCECFSDVGIDEQLILEYDPENKHDPNAIRIKNETGDLLGYVPRYYSEAVLYRLRAGVTYSCVVIEVNKQHMCEECIKVKLNMPKIE
jgi:hypothetical protein